jgi:hypothetical protein
MWKVGERKFYDLHRDRVRATGRRLYVEGQRDPYNNSSAAAVSL